MTVKAPALELAAEEMRPLPFRVASNRRETADTVTVELEPVDNPGVTCAPGQFTMVYAYGVGEIPISVAGYADDTIVHTVRAVGAVTTAISHLDVGDHVGVRGPYGVGWPMAEAADKDVVVAAGGIGLAPLRPVVMHLLDNRDRYGAVSLIYGARTPDDMLYIDELQQWRGRFDIEVEVTVDRAGDDWHGDVGLVTNMLPRITYDPTNSISMVCGPEIMMKVVARELGARGLGPDNVYLSMERNMKCAIGFCGHCQYGPDFVCRDGPVVSYAAVRDRLRVDEL